VKTPARPAKFAFFLGLCLPLSGWLIFALSNLNLNDPVWTFQGKKEKWKDAPATKADPGAADSDSSGNGTLQFAEAGGVKIARAEQSPRRPDRASGEGRYDQPREAVDFYRRKRLPAGETELPIDRYFAAIEAMRGMPQYSSLEGRDLPSRTKLKSEEQQQLGAWTWLGPGNIGGRTRALLIHPANPSTMYAAGVSGGVWRTTNSGASWTPQADLLANIAVNSLAMDPGDPNVIYAGTGEGYFNIDGVRGAGIFKTTDGGATWTRLAGTNNPSFYYVNDLVVSPVSSQRVYAATSTGVWRSLDGGANWSRVLSVSVNGGCLDLAIRSDRPADFLFASCGTAAGVTSAVQATIYRNTDAGDAGTWEVAHTEAGMGRASLAIAPSNQNIVYALSASSELSGRRHGLHAVFRSSSSGDPGSWTAQVRNTSAAKLNTTLLSNPYAAFYGDCGITPFGPNIAASQGWYDNVIAVDPADPNRVWAGGIDLFRSDDGGANWGLASYWWANGIVAPLAPQYAHADHHVIVFHPQYNGTTNRTMFAGNDGGIFRTNDARALVALGGVAACNPAASGVTWTSLNNNYGVTQFYHGLPYPNGTTYFGGTQDNGTLRGSDAGGANNWREIHGGDGGFVAVNPVDTDIIYAENTGISIRKSTDGGASFARATDGILDGGLFISPFVMDPSDPRRLWTGGAYIWRTTNGAGNWTRASAITAGNGLVSSLAVAPTNPNYLLAGMSDGYILRTDIGLTSLSTTAWPNVQPRAGHVSWVAFDPTSKDIAYATYSTFGGIHVWRSINGGASWTGIDGTGAGALPDIPVHCIVIDPLNTARLYVGTDLGVFVSTNGGASWAVENTGFANTVVESLSLNVVNGVTTLFAFTHGRGAWRVTANQTGCQFSLSQPGQSFAGAGGAGTINVTAAPSGCNWTATSSASWITINSGSSGSGNGTVGFTVAANTTLDSRIGTITAAGRAFTVTQQGCAAISPAFQHFEAAGGPGSFAIASAAACNWTVSNTSSWITVNSPLSGTGNATINFTVAANTDNLSRTATLIAAGQTFTVLQAGAGGTCASAPIDTGQSVAGALITTDCRSIARGSAYYADRYSFSGQAGQQIAIALSAPRIDTYLYLLNASGSVVAQGDGGGGGVNQSDARIPETGSFITLPAAGVYTIEATTFGSNRTGNYTLSLSGGSANCSYALSAAGQSLGINGGGGSVNVMAGTGCAWQAVSQAAWITINSGASGNGNGTVNFSVAANNTVGPRTGTIIIAGQVFTVTQGGQPALYRGEWRGTTADGLPVRFHVDANDMLVYLEIDVRVGFPSGTCTYTMVSTDIVPIENGQFNVPLTSLGFLLLSQTPFARGTLSGFSATGRTDNIQVFLAICNGVLIFSSVTAPGPAWTVQRQVACPTVSSINPVIGPAGTSVAIAGTNFTDVSAVKFGSLAASYTVNSDTQMTVAVPANAATGPIIISKPGCTDVQTPVFTVVQCPTVSGISPPRGLAASAVTITGTNFNNVTAVRFAGNAMAQFTVNSPTQITATVPANAITGPITISKLGCTDVQTPGFTVCSPIAVAPASLPDAPGGVAYSQSLTASGGAAPYSFAVTAGALPGGLTLSSTGALAGTPNVAGAFNFTVTTTDANGCTGTRSFTVNVTVTLGAQTRALYVLNDSATGNQIYGYAVNEATGALTLMSGFPFSTGGNGDEAIRSERLALDRANQRLYAINDGSDAVRAYAINPTTGALSPLPFSPISLGNGNWNAVAVHPGGSPLVVADASGRLASYQITSTAAATAAGSPFSTGSASPFSAAFSQDGNFAYTGGTGGSTIAGFAVNTTTGVLTSLPGSPFDAGNSLPHAYATDAAGRLFASNFGAGQVRVFTTSNGIPSAVSGNPFSSGLTNAIHGLLHPNGFYIVADGSGNRAGVYQVNGAGSATTLTAVTGSPFAAGGTLTGVLALNQASTLLFAANGDSRNLTTFTVNPATGFMTSIGTQPANTIGTSGRLTGMAYFASPCPAIALSPTALPVATAGTAYNQSVAASPALTVGAYHYSVTGGALPAGLSLDSATGALTGTPAAAGTINFTITALSHGPCSGRQAYSLTVNNPVPAIAGLTPPAVLAGGAGFVLTVNGSRFVNGSRVRWNGADRPTTFIDSTRLTVAVPASDIAVAGMAGVTVFNPAPGGGLSNSQSFTINNPVPATTALSPASVIAGGAGFTLTVTGMNFVNGSTVRWNNADRPTTFVSATQLTAAIPAGDVAVAGTPGVTVFNPAPGGGLSNAQSFTVNNPVPALTALSQDAVTAGGAGFTLTVTGTNFVNGSVVRWNGSERPTSFASSTQLTAAIAAADIATAGTAAVTVFNPAPGGGASNARTFTVNNPLPMLAGLSPGSTTVGGAGLTLTLNGASFVNSSVVRWNGADRPTTYVSQTQLTAAIPAGDIASAGTASVTVFNPSPGGGASTAQTFTINNLAPNAMSLSPGVVIAGGGAFTLTVDGANFVSNSTVRWNGANRATTFVSPTRLTATIPAADIATAGTARVTVFNPAPGGGLSSELTLTIAMPLASVSAASFLGAELTPESIVAAFGTMLATATQIATTTPLPTTLAGTTVKVRDSIGFEALAQLFFVAPTQINYLMPAGMANGPATVTATSGDGRISAGIVQIASVAPSLFSSNASGQGVAAGVALRVKPDGAQIFEPIARFDSTLNRFVPAPIDLDPETDQMFLILFGGGFRNRSSLSAVSCTIGGTNVEVLYAGPQGDLIGVDQANLRLHYSLKGRGEVDVVLTVDSKIANTVRIAIK
jgi:uncharacterized protein (TIGR03437 family)